MTALDKAATLIKRFEGLELEAYKCPAGVWTIGYGHTGKDVFEGRRISEEEADAFLLADMRTAQRCVANSVRVPMTDGQEAALISFVFNLGCRNFGRSTLLRHLNNGDDDMAALEFPKWNKSGGKELPGLTRRRIAEKHLFLS